MVATPKLPVFNLAAIKLMPEQSGDVGVCDVETGICVVPDVAPVDKVDQPDADQALKKRGFVTSPSR